MDDFSGNQIKTTQRTAVPAAENAKGSEPTAYPKCEKKQDHCEDDPEGLEAMGFVFARNVVSAVGAPRRLFPHGFTAILTGDRFVVIISIRRWRIGFFPFTILIGVVIFDHAIVVPYG